MPISPSFLMDCSTLLTFTFFLSSDMPSGRRSNSKASISPREAVPFASRYSRIAVLQSLLETRRPGVDSTDAPLLGVPGPRA